MGQWAGLWAGLWASMEEGVVLLCLSDVIYLLQLSQTGSEVTRFRPPQGAQHGRRGLSGRGRSICQ